MKKILLFVATMFVAVGANAQGFVADITGGEAKDVVIYAAGAEKTDLINNLTIKFGGASEWAVKTDGNTDTFTGSDGQTYSKSYIQGANNGMGACNTTEGGELIEGDYKTAPGLVHSSGESSHLEFTPAIAGTIYVAAKFGKNKAIFSAKVPQQVIDDEELDINDMTAYITDYKGLFIKEDGTYGATVAGEADTYATLPISVEPGNVYFFWVAGSKLMLSGLNFVAGEASVKNIKADAQDGAAYNLAGQKVNENYKGVIVKNGKKYLK